MEHIKNQSFPSYSKQEWKRKAEESLRGKTIDTLQSITYENIVLKPLYTREDELAVPDFPAGADFRRGIFPLGYVSNEWQVAQQISYESLGELKDRLNQVFANGQTALSFKVSRETAAHFSELTSDLCQKYPFAINSEWLQANILKNLADHLNNGEIVTGYIANDPISLFAKEGMNAEELLPSWLQNVIDANHRLPNLRTVLVNTEVYHNGGANAVQELAIAAAEGVFFLQKLIENDMKLELVLKKMIFQFSIGSSFFMEIAKLRAARVLWNRITELYGAKEEERGMQIAASTSTFTKTVFDPHVNLLRAANEAFAGVLGGIQYLHVEPFNAITGANAFSERIARNIQLILKEETYLNKVVDPAGGAWYVEALTNELAENAWSLFQQLEAKGGILEALNTGWLQQEIGAVYEARNHDVQVREQSLVGTNVYAKLDEVADQKPLPKTQHKSARPVGSYQKIPAILNRRLSEPFEELRIRTKHIGLKTGSNSEVGLLCLGERKQHKARADFIKGFLAAGSLQAVQSNPIYLPEEASRFIKNLTTNYVCLCGANEKYESIGHEILTALKAEFPHLTFFLAGLPDKELQETWIKEGIQQFIHLKSNCYETLALILSEMEVTANEVQKT